MKHTTVLFNFFNYLFIYLGSFVFFSIAKPVSLNLINCFMVAVVLKIYGVQKNILFSPFFIFILFDVHLNVFILRGVT